MKHAFKTISMVLVLMMLFTSAAFAAAVPEDVTGTGYEEAVKALVEAGAITGDAADGLFHGEASLTRAQACVIIVKTIDPAASLVNGTATQKPSGSGFDDMSGYGWAENYIAYAVKQGIVKGYPDGTFKPGNDVSFYEIVTMLLRASGYKDSDIGATWPTDYMAKAKEVGMLDKIAEPYPVKATKGMAAQLTFNSLEKLKAAAPKEDPIPPQGTDTDKPGTAPALDNMTFTNASFDTAMSAFGGKKLASDVKIYTYGMEKDYKKDMTFSKNNSDFRLDTVYKYKNVKTPAWCAEENGKITSMVLPMDVGFSGKAYGVVNDMIKAVNYSGSQVTGYETLTATNPITWYAEKSLADVKVAEGAGEIYEFAVSGGEVTNIATAGSISKKNTAFNDLTTAKTWTKVESYTGRTIKLDSVANTIVANDNAAVYVWNDAKKEYKEGTLSSIRAGKEVRLYSLNDKDGVLADIVVIK